MPYMALHFADGGFIGGSSRVYVDVRPVPASLVHNSKDCADCFSALEADASPLDAEADRDWCVHVLPPRLRRVDQGVWVPLGDGEHTVTLSPYQPLGLIAVLNRAAFALWQSLPIDPFSSQALPPEVYPALVGLYQAGLVVPPHTSISDQRATVPSAVSLWIEVTRGCNLDCPYCYVPKDGPVLSVDTFRTLLPGYVREAARRGLPLRLKFAGGEATLAWSHLVRLYRTAQTLAQAQGVSLEPVLLTNGTRLTPRRLDFLAQERFTVAFSIDGVGDGHDALRATRHGRSTIEKVRAAIEQAQVRGIRLNLINTITRYNVHEVPVFVAWALDLGVSFNLNFYRPSRWPDPLVPHEEVLIDRLQAALRYMEAHLPRWRFIDGLLDRARFDAPHAFVCDAGRSYHALDVHGRTAACPMLLGASKMLAKGFRVPAAHERSECATCGWRFWCAGGCPIITTHAYGSAQAPSPYCRVYKTLYPQLLRLEGLRVLRYGYTGQSPLAG